MAKRTLKNNKAEENEVNRTKDALNNNCSTLGNRERKKERKKKICFSFLTIKALGRTVFFKKKNDKILKKRVIEKKSLL